MNLENHEYESALLGCILLDNRVMDEIQINSAIFDNQLCRNTFKEIENIRAKRAVADIVTVSQAMRDQAAFIAGLTSYVPSAANARFYYDELAELARRRRLSSLARELGEEAINADSSSSIFSFLDKSLSEIANIREIGYENVSGFMLPTIRELEARYKNKGKLSGIDTGFPELNIKTDGWQKQSLVIIGARPGSGKTSIALNMASAAVKSDNAIGFFSAEMSGPSLLKRLIADWGSANYNGMNTGKMTPSDLLSIQEAGKKLADTSFFINDQPSITLDALITDARKMKRRENINILFVDYLSLISNRRNDIPRHEQVAEISSRLKSLARELDIPVIVLSQLTREAQGERPKLSQLRDSGAVEQDADIVILLHNLGWTDDHHTRIKLNLIVEKNRNGATGDIPMQFVPAWMRFNEVTESWT